MSAKLILQWWTRRDDVAPSSDPLREWLHRQAPATIQAAYAATPGLLLFADEPFWQIVLAAPTAAALPEPPLPARDVAGDAPLQIYRQMDEAGRLARDVIRSLDDEPAAGMVLLQPVWQDGRWIAADLDPARIERFTRQQRQALPEQGVIPVVDERGSREEEEKDGCSAG